MWSEPDVGAATPSNELQASLAQGGSSWSLRALSNLRLKPRAERLWMSSGPTGKQAPGMLGLLLEEREDS